MRVNIPNELQGRAWGVIGFISQLGYAVAYGAFGVIADAIARGAGISVGRGAGWTIVGSGLLLAAIAGLLYRSRSVRRLEPAAG